MHGDQESECESFWMTRWAHEPVDDHQYFVTKARTNLGVKFPVTKQLQTLSNANANLSNNINGFGVISHIEQVYQTAEVGDLVAEKMIGLNIGIM